MALSNPYITVSSSTTDWSPSTYDPSGTALSSSSITIASPPTTGVIGVSYPFPSPKEWDERAQSERLMRAVVYGIVRAAYPDAHLHD